MILPARLAIKAALEVAIRTLGEPVPSVTIASSAPGTTTIFTTAVPHLLKTGVNVTLVDHAGVSPSIDGNYIAVLISPTALSLRNIVTGAAIGTSLSGTGGSIIANVTQWENTSFTPTPGVPYQSIHVLFAKPINPSYGDNSVGSKLTRYHGYMQVNLYYPAQKGALDIGLRASAIEDYFYRGATFVKDGITVHIDGTPEVLGGTLLDEVYMIPVQVPFWADAFK